MGEEEMKEIASVKIVVDEIKDRLVGTLNEKGMISELRECTHWIKKQKVQGYSIVNTIYKVSVTVIVLYIASRVGLK